VMELTLGARLGKRQSVYGISPPVDSTRLHSGRVGAGFAIDMMAPAYSTSVSLRSEGAGMNRLSEDDVS
jgi:hypothetical protein